VVASAYEPIEPKFNQFRAPVAGHYKLRFNAYSVWVGPGPSNKWYIPNLDDISKGHRDEPVTITSETPPRLLRHLGDFDVTPEPGVHELDVWLLAGEMIRPDAGRLFRSRPGASRWQNPLAWAQIQEGMSRAQVEEILGKPTSVDAVIDYQTLYYKGDVPGAGVVTGIVKLTGDRVSAVSPPDF